MGWKTRIRNDEDLHALKMSADKARTDLERRHWLRAYYQLYFKKLRALASTPDLQNYLRAHQAAREPSLLQPRVRHETDEAEATALSRAGGGASATTGLAKAGPGTRERRAAPSLSDRFPSAEVAAAPMSAAKMAERNGAFV